MSALAASAAQRLLKRRSLDDAIILHFDYDCFYASVIENENPELNLKSLPLAVQQKQIVVTCNYEARRRGLYKLQLIKDAKKICPDVVIVLGEDLTRFRNASKELYGFFKSFSWNSRCERLGFDEVFMDVSDIIDYNASFLNLKNLANSFFCLSKHDPTAGFAFDASVVAGHTYPETPNDSSDTQLDPLRLRLHLASHLAMHLKCKLESEKGYTCTTGVSTNKLLSKLVGNLHKPNGQTTLLPPYTSDDNSDNVSKFIDGHEVQKIPGIGFKIAQKLRAYVMQKATGSDVNSVDNAPKEHVLVGDVKRHPVIGPETLERVLGGPGTPQGIGAKIWSLLHGCDDTEVGQARELPKQISIEDSYRRLDDLDEVIKELKILAKSLIRRMHLDLLEDEEDQESKDTILSYASVPSALKKRWVALPKTLRLSTRPRPSQTTGGSRNRAFARISRSAPFPAFVFNLKENIDILAERLVNESLIPLFRKLHPEKSGWDLSLMNVAATNIEDTASEKGGVGRDIGKMFKRQDGTLRQQRVEEKQDPMEVEDMSAEQATSARLTDIRSGSEDVPTPSQELNFLPDDRWESEEDETEDVIDDDSYHCEDCGAVMPLFAMGAHERWHTQN